MSTKENNNAFYMIDIKQLAECEKRYKNSPITLMTIKNAIDIILNYESSSYALCSNNVKCAINTLNQLNILVSNVSDKPIQLNS